MKSVLLVTMFMVWVSFEAQAKDVLMPADKVAAPGDARFFLVAIGTNKYSDRFWSDLKWAVRDAKKIAKAFGAKTNQKRIVHLLLDEKASRKKILRTLADIRRAATPRDIVAFYLSGHGTLALNDDGELEQVAVLSRTDQKRPLQTGLSHGEVRRWLASVSANRKLLVFATCHSGVGKSKLSPTVRKLVASNKGTYVPLAEVSEGALVLAASAKGEAAREDDKLKGDIYTHYLVEGLSTFDRNRDGMVTAMEAHDYARQRTYAHTRGRQRPTADAKFIGDADIPLQGKRKRSGLPVLEAYDPELAGFEIQVDDGLKGKLPSAFPLGPNGSYVELYTPGGRRIAHYRIDADQGETVSMDDILKGPPFSVAFGVARGSWADDKLERLTGESGTLDYNFQARYHWQNLSLGLTFVLPTKTTVALRPSLDLELRRSFSMVSAGYAYEVNPDLSLYSEFGLGLETVELGFVDTDAALTLAEERSEIAYELGVGGMYLLSRDAWLRAHLGYHKSSFDFAEYGTIDGERYYFEAGLLFRFGGIAKRL